MSKLKLLKGELKKQHGNDFEGVYDKMSKLYQQLIQVQEGL